MHINAVLGMTWASFAEQNFGDITNEDGLGSIFLEIQSYYLQIQSGDNSSNTQEMFDKKLRHFNNRYNN